MWRVVDSRPERPNKLRFYLEVTGEKVRRMLTRGVDEVHEVRLKLTTSPLMFCEVHHVTIEERQPHPPPHLLLWNYRPRKSGA
jgi:hypothetical protein